MRSSVRTSTGLAGLLIFAAICSAARAESRDGAASFDSEIAPLLASRCLNCHSGAAAKGNLDLTSRSQAISGGDSGSALVPGRVDDSLLWQRVRDDEMPPEHPLEAAERETLRQWIEQGAIWGTDPIDPLRYTTSSRAGIDWWSLQPLKPVQVPETAFPESSRNEIDQFVVQKLKEAGLAPSPPSTPRALIRRLYFDLIGLPPTPEAVAEFEADPSDARYRAIVNELLAAPEYGERWGRHWLDVARFGESNGFERNDPRDSLWPYRDWVIESLNADMPFDRFARMQIAGDLEVGGLEGAAAVGFLVAGVHNTVVGSSERMKRLARQDELEEIAATVGQAFLGLTIHCARCHDHKFDPIRNEEYYRFISALDGVQHGERKALPVQEVADLARLEANLKSQKTQLAEMTTVARQKLTQRAGDKTTATAAADAVLPWMSWDFETGYSESNDRVRTNPSGNVRVENGALILDGRSDSFVATDVLGRDLEEKTIEAWVQLDDLDQRGGGVVSLEIPASGQFDAIVFGEREPRRWMAGSEGFVRTSPFQGDDESAATQRPVHVALTYQKDGTITAYREGLRYGASYQTGFQRFPAGQSRVLFGLRHSPPGGNKMLTGRILHANLYDQALSAEAIAASAAMGPMEFTEESLLATMAPEEQARWTGLHQRIKELQTEIVAIQSHERTFYSVTPQQPEAMRVHLRGGVTDFGDIVAPGGVQAVTGDSADFQIPPDASDRERRLKLADWITRSASPLFTRVIVNRLWQHHFGEGLVETPSDFGFNGGLPSHPELLEWLAGELQRQNYRLKPLHRLIVTSATYRQSSQMNAAANAQDGDNRLLWRSPPQRMEAEVLRDSILRIAGVLDLTTRGGPGYRDVTITSLNGTAYYESIDEDRPEFRRRTIYRFVPRGGISTVLETFDCPDPSVTSPRRSVTTTPLQALSLLNNEFVLAMSKHLAERVQGEAGNDELLQVRRAWRLCLERDPDPEEEQASLELIRKHGLPALARGLFNANEFVVIE
jgi:hypothetical protein